MKRAIKTHFKDFLAITGLIILALAVLLFILSNQKAALPSWIPLRLVENRTFPGGVVLLRYEAKRD